MKYKHGATEGEYHFIDDAGNKSASFNAKNKPRMVEEMQAWVNDGNEVEAFLNVKELAEKEAAELETAKTAYIGLRLSEYPPIGDQLDYIYHNGLTAWKTNVIKPIKDKYPKP